MPHAFKEAKAFLSQNEEHILKLTEQGIRIQRPSGRLKPANWTGGNWRWLFEQQAYETLRAHGYEQGENHVGAHR